MMYEIQDTDTVTGETTTTYVEATNPDHAQEVYVDMCEANGVVHGVLRIVKVW